MTAGAPTASAIAATTTAAANAPTRHRHRGAPLRPDARTFLRACLIATTISAPGARRNGGRQPLERREPVSPHGTLIASSAWRQAPPPPDRRRPRQSNLPTTGLPLTAGLNGPIRRAFTRV